MRGQEGRRRPVRSRKIFEALFHISGLVLWDMRFLAQMGGAGLGHGAGPQVRRLLEAATVVWDMREHSDENIAKAAVRAYVKKRGFTTSEINKSKNRMSEYWEGKGYPMTDWIREKWEYYNSESHFNLCQRVDPAGGLAMVRDGIAMGYIVINELALFLSEHCGDEHETESSTKAESRLDECGRALQRSMRAN